MEIKKILSYIGATVLGFLIGFLFEHFRGKSTDEDFYGINSSRDKAEELIGTVKQQNVSSIDELEQSGDIVSGLEREFNNSKDNSAEITEISGELGDQSNDIDQAIKDLGDFISNNKSEK